MCKRNFPRNSELKKHLKKVHQPGGKYERLNKVDGMIVCKICDYTCYLLEDLKKHLFFRHIDILRDELYDQVVQGKEFETLIKRQRFIALVSLKKFLK